MSNAGMAHENFLGNLGANARSIFDDLYGESPMPLSRRQSEESCSDDWKRGRNRSLGPTEMSFRVI